MLMKPGAQTLCKSVARQFSSHRVLTSISRSFVLPQAEAIMAQIETKFALRQAARLGSSGLNPASLLTNVPLAVVNPVSYTLDNVRPFDTAV